MNQSQTILGPMPAASTSPSHSIFTETDNPQSLILDTFFPGFSLLSSVVQRIFHVDLSLYIPSLLLFGVLIWAWNKCDSWVRSQIDEWFTSTADIRIDDEMYNMLMSWVTEQPFSQRSRHFVANTDLTSRNWWGLDEGDAEEEEEEEIEFDEDDNPIRRKASKTQKMIRCTPSFGNHYFWYRGRLMMFSRALDSSQSFGSASSREEISVSTFGRNPDILKDLLEECRTLFTKQDENKTIIYRGGCRSGSGGVVQWTRCVSRVNRPFSTVVLDEEIKQGLLNDMKDYLHPSTRRWYSNRGIPYRRGYLLAGPPGTGKSSLSFAIAGYFKLKIYIVSLNSGSLTEEKLEELFGELPKQCVVLLEDIDTAGMTQSRVVKKPKKGKKKVIKDDEGEDEDDENETARNSASGAGDALAPMGKGRISLSALLNVIDGVASQEGRVLIMTTNHIEQLDDALIRPGRVDMTVQFTLATTPMITTIFHNIFATLEDDVPEIANGHTESHSNTHSRNGSHELVGRGRSSSMMSGGRPRGRSTSSGKSMGTYKERSRGRKEEEALQKRLEEEQERKMKAEEEKVALLAEEFGKVVPALQFSPAEIQGYLLKHKHRPENAVKGAKEWVVQKLDEKTSAKIEEEKRKVEEEKKRLQEEKEEDEEDVDESEGNGDSEKGMEEVDEKTLKMVLEKKHEKMEAQLARLEALTRKLLGEQVETGKKDEKAEVVVKTVEVSENQGNSDGSRSDPGSPSDCGEGVIAVR